MYYNEKIYPIKINSIYKERVWGGAKLKSLFEKKNIPKDKKIGEIWALVDRDKDCSIIENGLFSGKAFKDVIAESPLDYLGIGKSFDRFGRFPLLIKFLDASSKLSVQVHPDDELAKEFNENDTGKTEFWYIIDADSDAKIVYGCLPSIKEINTDVISSGNIAKYLKFIPIEKGDCVFVPAGIVHALLGGAVVLEIQQNSDVTYRLYDWENIGVDGNPRELHLEKGIKSIKTEIPADGHKKTKNAESGSITKIIDCEYMKAELIKLGDEFNGGCDGMSFNIIVTLNGESALRYGSNFEHNLILNNGDVVFLPAVLGNYKIYHLNRDQEISLVRIY